MAVLTSDQLVGMMRDLNRVVVTQNWTKAQVSAAIQAIEDRMQLTATKQAISGNIEAAAPGVFDADQKAKLFAIWSVRFAIREGIL